MVVEEFNPQYGELDPVPVNFRQGYGTIASIEAYADRHNICYPVDGDMLHRERREDQLRDYFGGLLPSRRWRGVDAAEKLDAQRYETRRGGWVPSMVYQVGFRVPRVLPGALNNEEIERVARHGLQCREVMAYSYVRF